jgi:hypothetical protein
VEVVLKDGRRFETRVAMPMGSLAAPFPTETYWTKYQGCVAGVMEPEAAAALRRALERLPALDHLGPIMEPLAGPFTFQHTDPQ